MKPNLAWAAGLFEGEGTISRQSRGRWQIALSSTDLDVILAFAETVAVGKLYGPYSQTHRRVDGGPCKSCWKRVVSDGPGIQSLATHLMPYLGSRRAGRLEEAVAEVVRLDLTRRPHTRAVRTERLVWVAGEGRIDRRGA